MSSIFSIITRFFQQKYTKTLLILGGIIVMSACFGQATSGGQYTESEMTRNIIEIFDLIFGLLALVLGPMVVLAGWLLSPDWTMGDFFGLRGYFKEVWILVANIVYIIFALMLLWMAIMQIFGGAESEYAFKKKLPKFLVGILIVPFTWLIVSWTLSFANQAVAAVLSIPMGSIAKLDTGNIGKQSTSMWHKKVLPTQFDFTTNASGYGNMTCENGTLKGSPNVRCISPAEFLTENQAGPFFIIMIYAYNIFKIQEADLKPLKNFCDPSTASGQAQFNSAKSCVENLLGIVRDFGLSLVVTIFFAVMLVALCWVLLMRAIKLWIYIMLSPLFGLAYFTGKGFSEGVGEAGESGFGQVGFKQFFQLAMVPVLVSAVLAFGILFVGVVRDNFHGGLKNTSQTEFCTEQNTGYMVTYCITEAIEQGEKVYYSKLIIGTDTTSDGEDSRITLNFGNTFDKIIGGSEAASVAAGAVSGGISSVNDIFAHIILTMMALVFMFMGVKLAVQYDAVTKAAFEPFAKLGASVGNFVAHSPSYLPLPHPAFAALSPAGMKGLSTKLDQIVYQKDQQMARSAGDLFDGQLNSVKSVLGDSSKSLQESADALRTVSDKLPDNPNVSAQALKRAFEGVTTEGADKLRQEIDANKNNHTKLQKVLTENKELIEKIIRENPDKSRPMQDIIDTVTNSSGGSARNTPRHINLTGLSPGEIKGTKAAGYKIEHDDGQEFEIPKLITGIRPPDPANTTNRTYQALRNDLKTSDNKLDKNKVRTILPDISSEEEYRHLATFLGLNPPD